MSTLPQLIEEDIHQIEDALADLLNKSEAQCALVIDKGGFLIVENGDSRRFDTTTLGALAAAMYAATQGIAGLVNELNFSCVYQQGEKQSIFVSNVDEHCLVVVIFDAQKSVGAVKYYAAGVTAQIAQQMRSAHERAPDQGLDLSVLNVADTSDLFTQKAAFGHRTEASAPEPQPVVAGGGDTNDDAVVKLQKIKKLLAGGLITQEDFEFKKRKILEEM